jgi:UDP-N-acetylmuramyl pentapeptide phosphotransferase/UDP-N-acetylglucosamine-1-phosphate transferase
MFWTLVVASIPAFAFGILEDITKRVSVRARLLSTMLCGVLGWQITGYAITDVNIPIVDRLLSLTLVSVLFTAFAVSGVANALNIIDGFNGLAAGASLIMFAALANISYQIGDTVLVTICLTLMTSILGFMVLNWPLGRIFMGDGGAYFVGFSLAWVSVLLLSRNPQVSAWAPLLVCGYPVLEVLFSIYRRKMRNHQTGHPDRLHLHSLVNRRFIKKRFPNASRLFQNSLTGSVMWLAALLPASLAILSPTQSEMLIVALLLCAAVYVRTYKWLTDFI